MSRTYRKGPWYSKLWGKTGFYHFISFQPRKNRDKKDTYNPPRWFKKVLKRRRKAQVRSKIQNKDYENVPRHKKEDRWEWL